MDRKALSKKIFQKHFASVTLTRAVDWHALLDRNQSYQPICHALRMARSSGRGLSGKWCCSRHSLSTMCVYLWVCECWGWQSIQSKLWLKNPCVLKDQNSLHWCIGYMWVCVSLHLCACELCFKYSLVLCCQRKKNNGPSRELNWRNMIPNNIYAVKLCCQSSLWRPPPHFSFFFLASFRGKNIRSKKSCRPIFFLWIWKHLLDISYFITTFHSSSCSSVDHQFGLQRPSCH